MQRCSGYASTKQPDDFCIATGKQYTVRQFIEFASDYLDVKIRWEGAGVNEKGYNQQTDDLIIAVDSCYFHPTEVETLLGDPTKAKQKLGWEPKITLEQMVYEMMENDINLAKRDKLVKQHGYKIFDYNE